MPVRLQITGRRFERLIVLKFAEMRDRCSYWLCECDCGRTVTVKGKNLINGDTRSCGCLRYEVQIENLRKRIKGYSKTPEYIVWCGMIQRCTDPQSTNYNDYGGRGIIITPQWRSSFEQFLHDMGSRPSKSHTIERKDNDGPYSPENCYWATRGEQNRNTRRTHFITFQGKTLFMTDWAIMTGIPRSCIKLRLKRKWTIERALTVPPQGDTRRAMGGPGGTISSTSSQLGRLTIARYDWSMASNGRTPAS
jgi:hypothetical protein